MHLKIYTPSVVHLICLDDYFLHIKDQFSLISATLHRTAILLSDQSESLGSLKFYLSMVNCEFIVLALISVRPRKKTPFYRRDRPKYSVLGESFFAEFFLKK